MKKDVSLTDIKLEKGVSKGAGCDKEAIHLMEHMPKWQHWIEGGKNSKSTDGITYYSLYTAY